MLSFLSKKLILMLAFVLMSTAVYSQTPPVDPLADLDVDATVKQQVADFETMIRAHVKSPINLKFVDERLPQLLVDYKLYLTKYYQTVKAIDPTVTIDDLPLIDKTLKAKFGWSTYDLMVEYDRLVGVFTDEILPYVEADIYEQKWGLTKTEEVDKTSTGTSIEKSEEKSEYNKTSNYDYDYILNYLTKAEEDLASYKTKWEEHQRTAAKDIDEYSNKTRSYLYSEKGVKEDYVEDKNSPRTFVAGDEGTNIKHDEYNKVFVAGEHDKEIKGTSFSEFIGDKSVENPTPGEEIGLGAKYATQILKNAFLVDDLNSIFLLEREIAIADYELESIDTRTVDIKLFKDLLNAYQNNQDSFKKMMKALGVKNSEKWMEDNFVKLEAQTEAVLALQSQKAEVNKLTGETFGKGLVGSSINILLAATIKDAIFTALDQSSFTSWLDPKDKDKDKTNKVENKWSSFGERQLSRYTSRETWAGLLTFLGTAQTFDYAGRYLIKGWEKKWGKLAADKALKTKDIKFENLSEQEAYDAEMTLRATKKVADQDALLGLTSEAEAVNASGETLTKGSFGNFVKTDAEAFVSSMEGSSVAEVSTLTAKLNGMFKTEMYASFTDGVGSFAKETFRLVKGFGFFSIGFALGDRFSRYVTTSMTFDTELSLPDNDPVKIATKALIKEMTSSGGSWAGTANTAISLFLAEVLMTKAAVVPKYYSAMKELNKSKCAVTYNNLKKIFEKNLAKNINKTAVTTELSKWGGGWTGLKQMTILFGLQTYLDELVVSKLLFTGTIADYNEKMKKLSQDLQITEITSLLKEMVLSGDVVDVEIRVYKDFEEYLYLGELITSLKARHNDVLCCLSLTKQERSEGAQINNADIFSLESGNQLAFSCLVNLVGNISDPTKTPFTCSPAALQANKDISLVKDIMTPVQKKMLEDNKEKIVNFHQALEDQDDMVKLIEKGKFTAAEKMLTDGITKEENDGGYNADVVKTLNETIDKISNGYSTMTIESGLEMLETLFTETYPTIIGTNTQTDIKIKKDVLNALSTAVYRKLEVVGAFYSKDGLVGEDYLQSKIYSLLQLVVMMPETYPGHKSSIYWTVARLGFKGVTTSMGGITNIDIPENLQKESDKKKLLDEKNSEDIKLITPDNGGSGTIKIDTNPAIDTTKTVIPNKK